MMESQRFSCTSVLLSRALTTSELRHLALSGSAWRLRDVLVEPGDVTSCETRNSADLCSTYEAFGQVKRWELGPGRLPELVQGIPVMCCFGGS